MDQKQAAALQDTLSKLPKWARAQPIVRETLGALIESGSPHTEIVIAKINRKKSVDHAFSVTQTLGQFGEKQIRQLFVVIQPTDKITEIETFNEA